LVLSIVFSLLQANASAAWSWNLSMKKYDLLNLWLNKIPRSPYIVD
jgi:hypothetical protein